MDRKPRKDDPDDLTHFKNERLRAILYVVRQARLMFEAAAASRWVTWWVCSAMAGSAALAFKGWWVN